MENQTLEQLARSVVKDHEQFEKEMNELSYKRDTLNRLDNREHLDNAIALRHQALEIYKIVRDGRAFPPYQPNSAYDQLRQLIIKLMQNN